MSAPLCPVSLHDRAEIEAILRRDADLHLYEIGDLDPRFWPHTKWWAARERDQTAAIAMLYTKPDPPVLIFLSRDPAGPPETLLRSLTPLLPSRLYAHLSDGFLSVAGEGYEVEDHGPFRRMILTRPDRMSLIDTASAYRILPDGLAELEAFYREAYPGNWFDPWMIETGAYFGVRVAGRLASAAGVHVISSDLRVAALGNIATRPEMRGRGLAAIATAALCRSLIPLVDRIGLNVAADNVAAISCYTRLGFERVAGFHECPLIRRRIERGKPAGPG